MPADRGVRLETRRLDRLIAQLPGRAERMIALEAAEVVAGAQRNTTRVETGAMRAGWHATRTNRFTWRVATNILYAVFHEFGTSVLSAAPMLGPALEAVRRARPGRLRALFRP